MFTYQEFPSSTTCDDGYPGDDVVSTSGALSSFVFKFDVCYPDFDNEYSYSFVGRLDSSTALDYFNGTTCTRKQYIGTNDLSQSLQINNCQLLTDTTSYWYSVTPSTPRCTSTGSCVTSGAVDNGYVGLRTYSATGCHRQGLMSYTFYYTTQLGTCINGNVFATSGASMVMDSYSDSTCVGTPTQINMPMLTLDHCSTVGGNGQKYSYVSAVLNGTESAGFVDVFSHVGTSCQGAAMSVATYRVGACQTSDTGYEVHSVTNETNTWYKTFYDDPSCSTQAVQTSVSTMYTCWSDAGNSYVVKYRSPWTPTPEPTAVPTVATDADGTTAFQHLNYANNEDLDWNIPVLDGVSGSTYFIVTFTSFQTEQGFDFVYVGATGTDQSTWMSCTGVSCGPLQASSDSGLTIHFHSDSSVTENGFSVVATRQEQPTAESVPTQFPTLSGVQLASGERKITHLQYMSNEIKYWNVSAPAGTAPRASVWYLVHFVTFAVEQVRGYSHLVF